MERPAPNFASTERTCPPRCASKRGAKIRRPGPETRQFPLPPDVINRVVVLGDTGCRVAKKHKLQKCDDAAWPFEDVAKHAADAVPKPDLVIHLGDYLYREEDGYGWTTWQEDFFKPAKHLLAAAPWIMIRGNHETCSRAAEGWFRFLDGPKPTGSICPDMSKSFVVDLGGGFGIVVMDSASVAHTGEDDADEDEDEVPEQSPGPPVNWKSRLVANYNAIKGSIPRNAWLATHLTFNGIRIAKKQNTVDNFMLQNAVGQILSSNVKLNVSGHIHLFEALNFSDKRRPQLVVGPAAPSWLRRQSTSTSSRTFPSSSRRSLTHSSATWSGPAATTTARAGMASCSTRAETAKSSASSTARVSIASDEPVMSGGRLVIGADQNDEFFV